MFNNLPATTEEAIQYFGYGDFIPLAYYDKTQDTIYVHLTDGSYTENYCNKFITFLRENHGLIASTICGFNITNVKYLMKELNIDTSLDIYIRTIVVKLLEKYPDENSKHLLEYFRSEVRKLNLKVNLNDDIV